MTDSFIAKVLSFSLGTKKGKIQPLVIMQDGKKITSIDAKAIGGVTPSPGDLVLVIAIRNNLDDKEISFYYNPSWSNCRIVAVAATDSGTYKFTGNYQFTGGITFTGNLTVTKDLNVTENLIVGKNATISKNLTVTQDASIGGGLNVAGDFSGAGKVNAVGDISTLGDLDVTGTASVGGLKIDGKDWLLHFHSNGNMGAPTGTGTQI